MIEVKISSISLTQVGFAIILRNDVDERVVPIFIGPLETDSISAVLSNTTPPRPKTHDLMTQILQELEAQILRVVITELKNNTFYAHIFLKTDSGVKQIDARPSDSIALALRVNAPIFIDESVLEEAGITLSQEEEHGEEPLEKEKSPVETEKLSDTIEAKGPITEESKLSQLRKELNLAVELENYEDAARIRDQIKKLSSEHN